MCVGNDMVSGDDLGPMVFKSLKNKSLPDTIEVIDGGLQGLNLIRFFEKIDRVILVDSLCGFNAENEVIILDAIRVAQNMDVSFSHSNGLGYLLRILPEVLESEVPEIILVGREGKVDASSIRAVTEACLRISENNYFRIDN
ncbi:MAG: hydrogenase maturation protease [Candidatus Riflebacteria bacterium]|nr:hydrogenase maturation protease [Candidatus Riflebacteria bacterium]